MTHSPEIAPEAAFVDGVVEYHQYRDELGMTLAEAKTAPDTLEVFEKLATLVAESDELRTAYTGVLRSRGKNREAATERVREIEGDIVSEMHEWDLLSDAAYTKKRDELATNEGVKKAAENFVKLFAKFIPKDELPKRKKPVRTRKQNDAAPAPEIEQASRVFVEKDTTGKLRVNGTELELAEAPESLLSTLVDLHERDPELHMRVDTIKSGWRWRKIEQAARMRGEASPRYSDVMSELRESLHTLGLANMVEADGAGRGRTYRARVNELRYVKTFDEPKEPIRKPEPTAVEPVAKVEPQDQTEKFFEKLETFSKESVPNPEAGILISAMRRRVAKELNLDTTEANEFVNNMIRGGLLHVIDHQKGVRMVSPRAREAAEKIGKGHPEQLETDEPEAIFTEADMEVVSTLVSALAGTEPLRGAPLKALRARFPEYDRQINAIVRRLSAQGYVDLYENTSKRNRPRPFVRFASLATMNRARNDREQLIKEIASLLNR